MKKVLLFILLIAFVALAGVIIVSLVSEVPCMTDANCFE